MERHSKIYIAGHRGLVGSAIMRTLYGRGFTNLITRTHLELDLRNQANVNAFFAAERPEYVFLSAAKVGGIHANATYPAQFLFDNLAMAINIIDAACKNGVTKLLYLGSSCIYPKLAPQPIKEEYLLTGSLEPTNEPYALAKIAGIKLCQAYRSEYGFNAISAMPTNLYGPGDNFHPENSHVIPALMRRFHEATRRGDACVRIWGSGTPLREFLHVDDLAEALVFLMERYEDAEHINVGTGRDITITQLAALMAQVTGYSGKIEYDPSKPDGTPRKLLDVSRINALGWQARIPLEEGLTTTYQWYCGQQ